MRPDERREDAGVSRARQDTGVVELADALWQAEVDRAPIAADHRASARTSTVDDAYAIQTAQRRTPGRGGRGGPRTQGRADLAAPMQRLLGVDEPDFGVLLDDMFVDDGDEIALETLLQPRVEAEMAFVMARDLAGPGVTVADALTAIGGVLPAIEVVDSRIADWRISSPTPSRTTRPAAGSSLGGADHPGRRARPAADRRAALPQRRHRSTAAPAPRPSATRPAAWRGWRTSSARLGRGLRRGDIVLPGAAAPDGAGAARRRLPGRVRPPRRASPCSSAGGRRMTGSAGDRRRPDRGRARPHAHPPVHPHAALPRRRDGLQGPGAVRRAPAAGRRADRSARSWG